MTVEEARNQYLAEAANAVHTCNGSRRYREQRWLIVDAASIALDMAQARESDERIRAGGGVVSDSASVLRGTEEYRARRAAWRKANPDLVRGQHHRWSEANRERIRISARARERVARAIARGDLVRPSACEQCGITGKRIEGAHGDYTKPLEVHWLCKPCHARWDAQSPKTKGISLPYDRAIGTRVATARLSEDDVRAIRERYTSGAANGVQLAKEFGVGTTTIYQVIRGKTWSHVS